MKKPARDSLGSQIKELLASIISFTGEAMFSKVESVTVNISHKAKHNNE